jgi:hypothetical protein
MTILQRPYHNLHSPGHHHQELISQLRRLLLFLEFLRLSARPYSSADFASF